MAQIKYLDSRRIMGASGDTVEESTFEDDFTSYANTTEGDTAYPTSDTAKIRVNPTNDNIDFDLLMNGGNKSIVKDLGSISDKFVLRGNMKFTTLNDESRIYIGLSDSNQTVGITTNQNFIGFAYTHEGTATNIDGLLSSIDSGSGNTVTEQDGGLLSINTDYYFEIIRNELLLSVRIYSDPSFSTVVKQFNNVAIPNTISGLQYLKIGNMDVSSAGDANSMVGVIDNIKFYNGVTSVTAGKPKQALSLSGCKAYYNFEQTGTPIANTSGSTNFNVYSVNQYAGGVAVFNTSSTLYNQTMNTMTFYIRKTGSPTGTGECRVYNGGTLQATSSNTIDVSTLTTDYTPQKFTFSTPYTIQSGDDIIFYYTGGDGTNYTSMHGSNTNVYDSTNTGWVRNVNGSWERLNTYDMKFTLNEVSLENIATTANGFDDGLGSSADGTNNGATTGSTGKVGSYAWDFDGTNDYVSISKTPLSFVYDSDCTVAFWVNGDVDSMGTLISVGDGNDNTSAWQIKILTAGDAYIVAGGTYVGGTGGLNSLRTASVWQHIVITWSGSTVTVYKNNSQVVSGTATRASNSTGIRIGSRSDGVYLNGKMDELVFFDRALTSSEISALYNGGTGVAVNDSSLQAKPETNSIFVETDTAYRYWFDGSEWINPLSARGLFMGGQRSGGSNIIDYVDIATTGDATDFGDLTQSRYAGAGVSSDTRACAVGGTTGTDVNTIDYVTIATIGNATDFGDLLAGSRHNQGVNSDVRGVIGLGYRASSISAVMEYITIATTSNSTNFGSLTQGRYLHCSGVNTITRGVFGGGYTGSASNVMDYITIASTGNATDFGDLTVARGYTTGVNSSSGRGCFGGGNTFSTGAQNVIDYITIATTGNATDFGDLSNNGQTHGTCNSTVRGLFGGGDFTNSYVIDYITINTTGNATNFGNLSYLVNTANLMGANAGL